jgi:hypothetical protein
VFADEPIPLGAEVLEFGGPLLQGSSLPNPYPPEQDHYLQIGPDLYLGPSGQLDDYINHSCKPNCGVRFKRKRIVLVSLRRIRRDEEILFDYSTTIQDPTWSMSCACGARSCRKLIGSFRDLPNGIKTRYTKLQIVPRYLLGRRRSRVSASTRSVVNRPACTRH